MAAPPDSPRGPLDGIRIVDLTSLVSGPMATAVLADQGADVIKVENPAGGDMLRHLGCARGGVSAIFNVVNRGKRSAALDLRSDDGKKLLRRLIVDSDVFVENYRPGVAERMGFGYDAVRELREDIVYVSIRGFGETGPYADRRVYDAVIQGLSGLAASQADPATGEPQLVRNIVCDKATALVAAQAITAALLARERGLGGQHLHLSMLDASVAFLWPDVMQADTYLGDGVTPSASLLGILNAYPTRDGHATIMAVSDAEFEGLVRAVGLPRLLDDERFATVASRMEHAAELAEIVEVATKAMTTEDLVRRLAREGVPGGAINRPADLHEDPQLAANALLVELDDERYGRLRMPGPVATFDRTPAAVRMAAPRLGEHTDEIVSRLAGPGDERVSTGAGGEEVLED